MEVDIDRVQVTTEEGLLEKEDSSAVKQIVMDNIVLQQGEGPGNPITVASVVVNQGKVVILPEPGPTLPDGREKWSSQESGDQLIATIRSDHKHIFSVIMFWLFMFLLI